MSIRILISILIGKTIFVLLNFLNRGATAAPGLYALKINPKIIDFYIKKLKFSIIVSGTNGKTTTSRIIASILKAKKIKFFHNRTGSNLFRGVVSQLLKHYSLISGLPKNRIGLWEIDEAVLPTALLKIKPRIVILLNLFRDQLDRYGEIDTLAKKWKKALVKLPKTTTVLINADDPTIAYLGKNLKCKVVYFGVKDLKWGTSKPSHASDATLCPNCLMPLNYQACFVSHLGIYSCLKCKQIQPQLHFKLTNLRLSNNQTLDFTIQLSNKQSFSSSINLSGVYNSYNILAAYVTARVLEIENNNISLGFKHFKPAFGRLENIKFQEKKLKIMLVKNPTGFNQVLENLFNLAKNQKFSCLLVLNDLIADGRDVSWIWDVDMKKLNKFTGLKKIIVSGIRSEDMALRLKYTNSKLQITNTLIEKNLLLAVKKLLNRPEKNLYILPTYTAMLKTRQILNKMKLVHSSWND